MTISALITMKDILITIFSIDEEIYLAYWINVEDKSFHTINLPELLDQTQIKSPFLSDIEKIANLFPQETFFASLIRNDNLTVIIFTKEEEYLPISKNIFSLVQGKLLRTKRDEIENYLENFFSDTVNVEVQELLSDMHLELLNYSSFISVFDFDSNKLIASTLHKNRDENKLAREVFIELKRLDLIRKINLEVEIKKIGNLQAFFFYLKGLVFVIYAINVQVNTGIIRLKLKTFLNKNKPLLTGISIDADQKVIPKIVEVDLSGKDVISYQMIIKKDNKKLN